MFPQFASTAATFSRATALLTRVGTDAQLYDDPDAPNLALLLDSKYEAEKSEGLKRLIALMSQGKDVSNYFPQVVKNVASPSVELKKLVYIYLVHYAEKRPDEALLAINSFQKDLSDINPLVRAWALRAMSGIRVRVVLPLVVMAVNKGARDPSPYVRTCAAHAIPKVFALDHEQHLEALEELIRLLLNDNSPSVVGAVAAAFSVVCPDRLPLLRPRYQKICELLPSVDEWGQVVLMEILLRYVVGRHGFQRESYGFHHAKNAKGVVEGDPYLDIERQQFETLVGGKEYSSTSHLINVKREIDESNAGNKGRGFLAVSESWLNSSETSQTEPEEVPNDVQLLLQNTLPLLWSQNSAVVLAAARVHWFLARKDEVKKIVQPVIFLLRSSPDSQYVVLANLSTFVRMAPSMFEAYYEDFFITSADLEQTRALKLDLLCLLATETSIKDILREFQAYVRSPNRKFAADTVSAIGRCAVRLPALALACSSGLLVLARSGPAPTGDAGKAVKDEEKAQALGLSTSSTPEKISRSQGLRAKGSRDGDVVTQAVLALRTIVQQRPNENEEVLARLVRGLDRLKVPEARTVVIWMIGEFGSGGKIVSKMLPTVLRYLAGAFVKESDEAKLQILLCVAKVAARCKTLPSSVSEVALPVFDVVLKLGSQDLNYDVRDRARMLQQLVCLHSGASSEETSIRDGALEGPIAQLDIAQVGNCTSDREGSPSAGLLRLAERLLLTPKPAQAVMSMTPEGLSYLPGSMSHIVQHTAPNYRPLPQPFSINAEDAQTSQQNRGLGEHEDFASSDVSRNTDGEKDDESFSSRGGSADSYVDEEDGEKSTAEFDASSSGTDSLSRSGSAVDIAPLICLSDSEVGRSVSAIDEYSSNQKSEDLGLISSADLESWLGAPDHDSRSSSGYANILLGNLQVEPKVRTLLDFTNGGGLELKYHIGTNVSSMSENQMTLRLQFQNRGLERLTGIVAKLKRTDKVAREPRSDVEVSETIDEGASAEIPELDPGSTAERDLVVEAGHLGSPIKLCVMCNTISYAVKLIPDAGQLIKPVAISSEGFLGAQAQITGMHESTRRCVMRVQSTIQPRESDEELLCIARTIAQKVLGSSHVALVSTTISIGDPSGEQALKSGGVQGLCLRFSGRTISDFVLCLVEVAVLDEVTINHRIQQVDLSVKVNCENTVFGLTLLQEVSKVLSSVD